MHSRLKLVGQDIPQELMGGDSGAKVTCMTVAPQGLVFFISPPHGFTALWRALCA